MKRLWLVGFGAAVAMGMAADGVHQPVMGETLPTTVASRPEADGYREVIERTQAMVNDRSSQSLADRWGLDIVDVTWEDTGRYNNSAVGPNISDMTIQVQQQDADTGTYSLHLMPVIRYPNFADLSGDITIDRLYVLTGNEKGEALSRVPLEEVLDNLRGYLSEPDSWAGRTDSLLAPRDSHVLVSAQAAFLPIPEGGSATFNPVLFNYQSYPGDPAVLTLLATREGTSVTVIDNQRDGFEAGRTWGQRLFFNQNGERASLTGERASDFEAGLVSPAVEPGPPRASEAAADTGLNMVMLIQVPLKQKQPGFGGGPMADAVLMESAQTLRSDVETAVIGHGEVEGPFTEIDDLAIERDPKFPIRVTVQFYKATSNGVVSQEDMAEIHRQIDQVYDDADYVGSLVLDGQQGRPTEYEGNHTEPADWWHSFWEHSRERLDMSEESVRELWQLLRGTAPEPDVPQDSE